MSATIVPIAEVRIPVTLDRERSLVFDLNTMAAFESVTGKFYWDVLMKLFELHDVAVQQARAQWYKEHPDSEKEPEAKDLNVNYITILRHFPMVDFRAMVWAACHEYKGGKLSHPLTLDQVGQALKPFDAVAMVGTILVGHLGNLPTRKEVGEPSAPPQEGKAEGGADQPPAETGGTESTELPADAYA